MPVPADPVVVVGGGPAGLAAAARLAKAGHAVRLFERADALGGSWRPYDQPGLGPVDDAPGVLAFPAPWRDLFRKSGRPFEAELARSGHALVPAPATRYRFADGSELALPTDRAGQHAVLTAAYGAATATRWRDLLDGLDVVWQTLRPLGLEYPLQGRTALTRPVRARLHARRSLAWLAGRVGEPHLEALVRSVAHRHGAPPERTPAWVAVDLAVSRTFGHWHVAAADPSAHPHDTGRSSVLVEALAARLAVRRVDVALGTVVAGLEVDGGRVVGVRTADGTVQRAAAVLATTDPWSLVTELLPRPVGAELRRRTGRLRPAGAPTVSHTLDADGADGADPGDRTAVVETVTLDAAGVPDVAWSRPVPDGRVVTRHDFSNPAPTPAHGVAWRGFRGWTDRPPVDPGVPGLYLAGPSSPAGNGPSAVVLSGALASYACHDALG